jgi:gamma-glutamylcyclotransferase (GGCT)/AIG2-like uncharacterized protein YtfP
MTNVYFSYGSNMDVNKLKQICSSSKLLGVARVRGYRLSFSIESEYWIWKGGVGDIIRDDGSEVWGLIYELSDSDLDTLDKYEVAPPVYRRISIEAMSAEKKVPGVWTYEVAEKKGFVLPSKAYLDIIKSAAEKYGFPSSYKRFLDAIPTRD